MIFSFRGTFSLDAVAMEEVSISVHYVYISSTIKNISFQCSELFQYTVRQQVPPITPLTPCKGVLTVYLFIIQLRSYCEDSALYTFLKHRQDTMQTVAEWSGSETWMGPQVCFLSRPLQSLRPKRRSLGSWPQAEALSLAASLLLEFTAHSVFYDPEHLMQLLIN